MESPETAISFTTEKWVTAVTDLMALTQKRQLLWREDPAPREPYPGPCYITEFNGNVLVLQKKPLQKALTLGPALAALFSMVGSDYVLRAFKPDGEALTTFPSVAALNGLKIAIDAQLHSEEDTFLQAIHQATQRVAG